MAIKMKSTFVYACLVVCVITLGNMVYLSGNMPLMLERIFKFYREDHSLMDDFNAYKSGFILKHSFSEEDLVRKFEIVANGSDVIIFLRMQKTGSSEMEKHLSRDLDVSSWCKCQTKSLLDCGCYKNWKFNVMFAQDVWTGPCGIHANWNELHDCAERKINERHRKTVKQRHLYLTMVRDPLRRYVSEWGHVTHHGAVWTDGPRVPCKGKLLTKLKPCNGPQRWQNQSLQKFLECPYSMAVERQTRMLTNLSLVFCGNTSNMTYDDQYERMVASARDNLKSMAYFGLTEYQELSQILFENTFNFGFINDFVDSPINITRAGTTRLKEGERNRVLELNTYDAMLYQYAKDLFFQRLQKLAETTSNQQLRENIFKRTQMISLLYGDIWRQIYH